MMDNMARAYPDASAMSARYTQPGRKWVPRSGAFAGRLGAEVCATRDFKWVGLTFPGESHYRTFHYDELEAATG
jgi:hypothetical protein